MLKVSVYYVQILLLSFVFLISCVEKENKRVEAVSEENGFDFYQFKPYDLKPYDLNTEIMLPDETAGIGNVFNPEITHNEGSHLWTIQVGRNFILEVEDMGEIDDFFIDFRNSILESVVFDIEILFEAKNKIVYSKKLSKTYESDGFKTYHLFAHMVIDGRNYLFRNSEKGNSYNEIIYMQKSVESIELKFKK